MRDHSDGGRRWREEGGGTRYLTALSFFLSHRWFSSVENNLRTESVTCCVLELKMKSEDGRLGENSVFSGILSSGHCDYKALGSPVIKFSHICLSLSLICGSHRHTGRC